MGDVLTPTDEQYGCIDLFHQGHSMVIEALAGTGKTKTLEMIGASTKVQGRYFAYNNAIVREAERRMPANVKAQTMHSLAFGAVGQRYAHRLNTPRMKGWQIAQQLGIGDIVVRFGLQSKVLHTGFLGSYVMRALRNFLTSVDDAPGLMHFPLLRGIEDPTKEKSYENNDAVRNELLPALLRAWIDAQSTSGVLPFEHDTYLKLFAMTRPHIAADYIMLDEAQDADPIIAQIVMGQADHSQLVLVGDQNQAIYAWRGAVDAMETFDTTHRAALTQSWRFGPEVAELGNMLLRVLGSHLEMRGTPSIPSRVGKVDPHDTILCRTNARSITETLLAQSDGKRVHVVGGGAEVKRFAAGAKQLIEEHRSSHPDLACFGSWTEVLEYVESDPQGGDLRLLVDLVEKFGADEILKALEQMPSQAEADLIVSTAHKAKGLEWDRVLIAQDFTRYEDDAELRLLYVAATRGRLVLDDRNLTGFYEWLAMAPRVVA